MTLTDPRLRQAAELIEAVSVETFAANLNTGAQTPLLEAVYRLGLAHDAVTQADRLLAETPTAPEGAGRSTA